MEWNLSLDEKLLLVLYTKSKNMNVLYKMCY